MPSSRPRPTATSSPHPTRAGAVYGSHLLVGALVPPVLLGLVAARLVANGFRQAGLVSEQLLQGQRLPHLHVPLRE
ncbi:hypothetical protein GFS31_37900 [Leptolyngbya sp. BL0902]|uniref:hypothetical protein n=1 Tax=Leptolyngbya sp. BL0902 TaxID=1115757 RepID=UPI0018E89A2D|nr:hypothetical protein [Leptolyngbya sp. BL0902]QQE67083.1 hypothetical protein GFS31_37900 [Leptolyngbya sp. BL0902]